MRRRWQFWPRAMAFVGIAWLILGQLQDVALMQLSIAFGVLSLIPLGFALALSGDDDPRHVPFSYRLSAMLLPGLTVGGFFLYWRPTGDLISAMSSGGVTLFCLWASLYGVMRFLHRSKKKSPELAIDLALVWLTPAAIALFASRLGRSLFGHFEPSVLLFAEHSLHAGFALPLLTGVLGRHLPAGRLRTLGGLAAVLACVSMPLIALGIEVSRALEVPAALALILSVLLTAALLLTVAWRKRQERIAASVALALSALSAPVAMLFALGWALTGSGTDPMAGSAWASFEEMVRWHGVVVSVGFCGGGMLGLTLLDTPAAAPRPAE